MVSRSGAGSCSESGDVKTLGLNVGIKRKESLQCAPHTKKRKTKIMNRGGSSTPIWRCAECKGSNTPVKRNGPAGRKTLCNACGLRFSKKERRANRAASTRHSDGISKKGRDSKIRKGSVAMPTLSTVLPKKQDQGSDVTVSNDNRGTSSPRSIAEPESALMNHGSAVTQVKTEKPKTKKSRSPMKLKADGACKQHLQNSPLISRKPDYESSLAAFISGDLPTSLNTKTLDLAMNSVDVSHIFGTEGFPCLASVDESVLMSNIPSLSVTPVTPSGLCEGFLKNPAAHLLSTNNANAF